MLFISNQPLQHIKIVLSLKSINSYLVFGFMSGTSLDGLDIALCNFYMQKKRWKYRIISAKTYKYSKEWKNKLSGAENKSAAELAELHSEYGHFLGKKVKEFIAEFALNKVCEQGRAFISSHGHTIFHQPFLKRGQSLAQFGKQKAKTPFTFQIGSGAAIAAECGLPAVCDFRTSDVALGGQGAPLVPIGDKLLFSDYDYCLNIGGIANITLPNTKENIDRTTAFDICPANIVLNNLAKISGKEYDKNGKIAKSGKVYEKLLKELNDLEFYSLKPPKSLGKEWILKNIIPVLNKNKISVKDKMRTVVEHIAIQIGLQVTRYNLQVNYNPQNKNQILIVTGGGAHNNFLMERIKFHLPIDVIIPDKTTIDFKEALIFAFMGVLRMRNEINCLSSVTGAERDCCGGAVYLP